MKKPLIKVFYNSACPVCEAGAESQKKKKNLCGIVWNDVHLNNELAQELNVDIELVRERLHVIDENGKLEVGYNAFIVLWRNSENEKWKAEISDVPGIKQLLNSIYNFLAILLYRWNCSKKHW